MSAAHRPFSVSYQVAWSDLDANRHLRNTSYFDYAAQTRFLYFEEKGVGATYFAQNNVGPAALAESISYRRELHFLEKFEVDFLLAGLGATSPKCRIVNRFVGVDGAVRAEVSTLFVWFDLAARKAIQAPAPLAQALTALPRADDFETFD